MNESYLQILHMDCECSSPEHIYRIVIAKEDGYLSLDLQSYNYDSIFKRIIDAIRYIFRRGNITWVSVMPKKEDIPKLINFLQELEKSN